MQLIELLRQHELGVDDEATIFVERPWSPDALAIVISPAPTTTAAIERGGHLYDYFLECFIARDFLSDLAVMSEKHRCERVIRYAEADS